jgi:hypothetical protein
MSVLGILLLSLATTSSAVALQQENGSAPVLLTTTYTDGRTVPTAVTTRPTSSWTPLFPKIHEWRSPEGLTVNALGYNRVLEGASVRVDVLLLLGQPHQKEVKVTTVLVERERPVTVEVLAKFGVAPVTLSIGDYVAPALDQPQVRNKTTALQVDSVELVTSGPAAFRMTVRNLSPKPVMTFHVMTYRGATMVNTGRLGDRDGNPVVAPGETFVFQRGINTPPDAIEITGLMFQDGTIEGDAAGVATARLAYLGRRVQFSHVLDALHAAADAPIRDDATIAAALRAQIEKLSVVPDASLRQIGVGLLPADGPFTSDQAIDGAISASMREVSRRVLSDLASAPRDAEAFRRWLGEVTAQYRTAYLRFVDLTVR